MKKALIILLILFCLAASAGAGFYYFYPVQFHHAWVALTTPTLSMAKSAFERQLAAGAVDPILLERLVNMQMEQGDAAAAIATLEAYLAKHPDDLAARQRLSPLYQSAQRMDDYINNLEEINRLSPQPALLAELAQHYASRGDGERQLGALSRLIALDKNASPEQYKDLATLLASRQRRPEAIDALMALRAQHPQAFGFPEVELLAGLLLDERRNADAYTLSAEWRANNHPEETARLIALLHAKGALTEAESLMDSLDDATINGNADLLNQKIQLLLADGREADAFARLRTLYGQNALPAPLKNTLLFLAVSQGERATAQALLKELDLHTLNEQQALTLLDLSLSSNDRALRDRLSATFGAPEYAGSMPLTHAMVAVATRHKDADARLSALGEGQLSPALILQSAHICRRVNNSACTDRLLNRLPAPDALSDAEVAAVAEFYFDIKAYDKGYAFLQAPGALRDTPAVQEAAVKFLAARGDNASVSAWLDAHETTASPRTLKALFFIAQQAKQHALATRIAEMLHARLESPQTRSLLSTAYIASGEYVKTVTLLREAREVTEAEENNYLTALSRLAKTDPKYRQELNAYAKAQLNAPQPARRKMALINALVRTGDIGAVMPHIRALALKNDGEWAWMYATELTRQGKPEEARQFWIALANEPRTSAAQKREIAHTLLKGGAPADAEPIFRRLAEQAPADSLATRELLYVWGPRYTADQLDWLGARYAAAPAGELPQWASYISGGASDDALVPFVETRHPETLFAPSVLRAYVKALATRGDLQAKHPDLMRGMREHGDARLLEIYAATAREQGATRPAREAYEEAAALQPDNAEALRNLSQLSYAQADYSASRSYTDAYFNHSNLNEDTPENASATLYHYAEIMQRAGKRDSARTGYTAALKVIDENTLQSPEALTQKAKSQIALGRKAEGLATFQQALAAYPENDALRAEWIGALVDMKRYADARRELVQPLTAMQHEVPEAPASIPVPAGTVAEPGAYGREAVLHFSGQENDVRQFAGNVETLPWVDYTARGYHRLLVAARPGYLLKLERDGQGNEALIAVPAANDDARGPSRLRYELLAARIELETGQVNTANQRLNGLLGDYPGNPTLLASTAHAADTGGNGLRARRLMTLAASAAPENEDIQSLAKELRRKDAPGLALSTDWIKRGKHHETVSALNGSVRVSEALELSASVSNSRINAKGVRRADGRTGSFTGNRQYGELSALYAWENGQNVKASLYANRDTAGAGLRYQFLNDLGVSGVGAEYHRPYLEFSEGTLDNATRDRLSAWHEAQPDGQTSLRIEPGLNRYNTGRFSDVAQTWSLDARAEYRPWEEMRNVYVAYELNAEYMLDKAFRLDSLARPYKALPVTSHEMHALTVGGSYAFDENTYGTAMAGYGLDRLGGSGVLAEGSLTHEFNDALDAQLRASHRPDAVRSDDDVSQVGGYMRVRF